MRPNSEPDELSTPFALRFALRNPPGANHLFALEGYLQGYIAYEEVRRYDTAIASMKTSTQIASHLLRSRIGKICIAITGQSAEEMVEKASIALKDTSFIEFRLDYLPK